MKEDLSAIKEAIIATCNIVSFVGVVVLLFGFYCLETKVDSHEDNFKDVDRRITILEQSMNCTDSAVVKALQGVNESLYEIKLMKRYGNR